MMLRFAVAKEVARYIRDQANGAVRTTAGTYAAHCEGAKLTVGRKLRCLGEPVPEGQDAEDDPLQLIQF